MKRNITIENGRCNDTQALKKLDYLFAPAVSFRALTCVPMASKSEDWPDIKQVYAKLVKVSEMIGGNYPVITFATGRKISVISYHSRSGNSEFRWENGEYTIRGNKHSSLLLPKLESQDCTEVLTEESGYCYLHKPITDENPERCWVFTPEGGDWCHRYASLDELVQAEVEDWIKIV